MANLNCYSAQITNDKNREIRITAIGMDLNDSKKVKVFSTIIPLRDALPAMPKELMAGRKRDKTNIFSSTGGLASISQGNVTLAEKMATITIGDDLVFDLGKSLGAPTRSILKSMLTGEVFKSSATATSPIVTLGVAGNVVDATATCPSMVLGQDWKYLLKEDLRLIIPYGRGATKANSFMDTASSTQIGIMVEYKTTYGSGKVSVSRYAGACGGNLQDISGDDMNKFSVDLDFYSDAREYDDYFIAGGYDFDADNATEIKNIEATTIVTKTASAVTATMSIANSVTVTASAAPGAQLPIGSILLIAGHPAKRVVNVVSTTITVDSAYVGTASGLVATAVIPPTDFGTNGDVVALVGAGEVAVIKSTGSAWATVAGTFIAGSKVFAKKKSTTTLSAATTGWAYVALKSGGIAGGSIVATTVTTESGTGYTLGTTYSFPIMDYDFDTESFLAYIG